MKLILCLFVLLISGGSAFGQAWNAFDPFGWFIPLPEDRGEAEWRRERDLEDNPYTQVTRRYKGRMFVTFYHRFQKAAGRIQTFEWNPGTGKWDPINSLDLGKAVEDEGTVVGRENTSGAHPLLVPAVPVARKLYTLDLYNDPQVIVYTDDSVTPVKNVPIGSFADGAFTSIAISPDETQVFLLSDPQPPTPTRIRILDTATDQVSGTFNLASSAGLAQFNKMVASPDGKRLYIAVTGGTKPSDSVILVVDIATKTVAASVPSRGLDFGRSSFNGVWISPDSGLVYAATPTGIDVIDTLTLTTSTTIPVTSPFSLAFQPDGTKAYAAAGRQIYEIDVASSQVQRTLTFETIRFNNLMLTPDGDQLLGWDTQSNLLKIVDTRSMTLLPDIDPGIVGSGWVTIAP